MNVAAIGGGGKWTTERAPGLRVIEAVASLP